ncbi:FG-GAP repeat domain-containing protein [Actinokineospora sp. HUAS TT18]|uniref:FG-GAP repeat domain-containing protein n=1 Tax=Actinokineospora sp. HUAS TT18 TaxID=3447451 RepID=UPI003F51B8F7
MPSPRNSTTTAPAATYTGSWTTNRNRPYGDIAADVAYTSTVGASRHRRVVQRRHRGMEVPPRHSTTFGSETSMAWTAQSGAALAVGDFDGDGNADLAYSAGSGWSVRLGTGTGTFGTANAVDLPDTGTPVASDVNADGRDDLVVWNRNTGAWVIKHDVLP